MALLKATNFKQKAGVQNICTHLRRIVGAVLSINMKHFPVLGT